LLTLRTEEADEPVRESVKEAGGVRRAGLFGQANKG